MGTIKTTNIETITGSGTLTLGQSGETISIPTNTTLGASGSTITIPSGCTITNNGTQTGFGGANTPAFEAYNAGSQSIATNTSTLMQFPSESFDTDSAFNTSTHLFTVPSGGDGKYFFYFNIGYYNPNTTGYRIMYLMKNGAGWKEFQLYEQYSSRNLWQGHVTMDLVAGNTISLEAYQTSGTSFSTNPVSGQNAFFGGFKLIT